MEAAPGSELRVVHYYQFLKYWQDWLIIAFTLTRLADQCWGQK